MIKKARAQHIKYFIGFLFLSGVFLSVSALAGAADSEERASVTVSTRAIPSKATLGQEIRLFVEIEHPKAFSVLLPEKAPNLSPFEVKKYELSPLSSGNNRVRETLIFVVTTFEMGEKTIPSFYIQCKDASGRIGKKSTDAVTVQIVSVGKKKTDQDDIRPIQGPVKLGLKIIYDFFAGSLAFLLTIFLILKVFLRLKKERTLNLESLKPPHERAFLEMARLREAKFLESGKYKEFYSEFSDILRRYLERRFGIAALEHTTCEILDLLKRQNLDSKQCERVKDVLEMSDLVKFAKYQPSRSQSETLGMRLVEWIEMTKPADPPLPAKGRK